MKRVSNSIFKLNSSHLLLSLITLFFFSHSVSAQTVLLRDDFTGSSLNTNIWGIGTWTLGRTTLGNTPLIVNTSNPTLSYPTYARLTFDTYKFKGTEIFTKGSFKRGNGLEIEARVRLNYLPSGLVTSLFTYAYDTTTATSDELDIEILSKRINETSGDDPVLFTTWNNWSETSSSYQDASRHYSMEKNIPQLDVNTWHTYIIRWLPDRTEWLVDGTKYASTTNAQPEADTPVRLNFWAPASGWTAAYSSNLKPANRSRFNVRYYYDVDYVEVRRLP